MSAQVYCANKSMLVFAMLFKKIIKYISEYITVETGEYDFLFLIMAHRTPIPFVNTLAILDDTKRIVHGKQRRK
jgi:hypothetical protein